MRDFTEAALNGQGISERIESSLAVPQQVVAVKKQSGKVLRGVPPRAMRNSTFTLMALTLAACNGSDGESDSSGSGGGAAGNLVKGPVSGALVFVDYNGDGQFTPGEPTARTDANGFYSFESLRDNETYNVIALLDGAVDESSGRLLSGGRVFSSSTDASVITPFTTIITNQGISSAQLSEALGLSGVENFDPMSFNPYADDVDLADALLVEQTAQKVMTIVETLTTVFEASGADSFAAYNQALQIVSDQVQNAGADGLLSNSSVDAILNAAVDNSEIPVSDPSAFKSAVSAALATTFDAIDSATALDKDNANPEFKILDKLLVEVNDAVKNDDLDKLTVDDSDAEDLVQEIDANSAPVLALTSQNVTVSEATESLVVTTASATDADDGDTVTFSLSGADASDFIIDSITGVVSFKAQPNYEVKNSYSFEVVAYDGTEVTKKSVVVNVTDVTPAITVSVNPSLLTNLETVVSADLDVLEQRVGRFYGNEEKTGFSQKIAMIDFDSFGETDQDISFSSSGVSLSNSQGYRLDLAFSSFSPTSLEALADIVSQFEASGYIGDISISGGFQSITIYGPNSSNVVAQLAHTATGIEWRNPSSIPGDVDTFVIEGSFDNQIENYLSVFATLQDSYDPESDSIGDQALMDAVNSLSALVGFEGISAKSDGEAIFRIGFDSVQGESLTFSVSGAAGDHDVVLSAGGASNLSAGIIEAAGGLENFLLAAGAGFSATIFAYDQEYWNWLSIQETIVSVEEEAYYPTDNVFYYASSDVFGDNVGQFVYAEEAGYSLVPGLYPNIYAYDGFDVHIAPEEFYELAEILSNIRGFLGGAEAPLDDLVLNFSYSYADELVLSIEASEIFSLISIDDVDLLESAVIGGYSDGEQMVTEVSDHQERVALKLLGVDVDEFLDKQEELGGNISGAIEFYLTPPENDILSTAIV